MPRPRPDVLFVPRVSWTQGSGTSVSYGALVGSPSNITLLPRRGTDTAGFTLHLQWIQGAAGDEEVWRFLSDPNLPVEQLDATLAQSLPTWQTRCAFPLAELSRFDVLRGWKLWLGVSAVLQVGSEQPCALRIPDRSLLEEMRAFYHR